MIQPGIRCDYFNAKTERLVDESNPLDEASQLHARPSDEAGAKSTFAPRLGIAFPIDRAPTST